MSLSISNRVISRIHVIDDDKASRKSYGYTVEDVEVETVLQEDRVDNVNTFLLNFGDQDAIVSDFHLKKTTSYFPMNGAEFVALCYDKHIPSVLVTRFEISSIHEIRPFKHKIPTILAPDEFNTDTLVEALEICVSEFQGRVSAKRKPWRTLIRVDEVIDGSIVIFIPAWNPNLAIDLKISELPEKFKDILTPDLRFYAKVNIDAENVTDLYFTEWMLK